VQVNLHFCATSCVLLSLIPFQARGSKLEGEARGDCWLVIRGVVKIVGSACLDRLVSVMRMLSDS